MKNYLDTMYDEHYNDFIEVNMRTHDFEKVVGVDIRSNKDNLASFKCKRCKMLAVDIFWAGSENNGLLPDQSTEAIPITCDEAIIKQIIE